MNTKALETYAVFLLKHDLLGKIAALDLERWSILDFFLKDIRLSYRPNTIPFVRTLEPDVCLVCHYDYGDTIGGRLRSGCPNCQSFSDKKHQAAATFALTTGLHPAIADLVMARTIRKYL